MTRDIDDSAAGEQHLRTLVLVVLGMVVLGGALDVYLDGPEKWASLHVVVELVLMAFSATIGVVLWRGWRRTAHALAASERSRAAIEVERSAWEVRAQQALQSMAAAIDLQFDAWRLTPAEREVALALLQGHGHKQIAHRTGRSESTVRQHAVEVYAKSGQGGRAELAAFFLSGLMLPADAQAGSVAPRS